MNLNKLPCVNTILLNRYLAEQDREAAYTEALESAIADAQSMPITEDDVYELACSLEAGSVNPDRIKLAKLLNDLDKAVYTREAMAELVGFTLLGMLGKDRAERATKTFEDEQ